MFKKGDRVKLSTRNKSTWAQAWRAFLGAEGVVTEVCTGGYIRVKFDKNSPNGVPENLMHNKHFDLIGAHQSHPLTTIFK